MKQFFILSISFLLLTIFAPIKLSAQDIIVKVKQGTAKLNGKGLTESTASVTMKNADVLSVGPNALVIARQDAIIIELPSNKEHSYSSILAIIKKKKQATNGTVSTLAFKDPILKTNPTPLKGSSTRGHTEDDKPNFYYPYDNMLVYDSHLVFFVGGNDSRIVTPVVVKNKNNNEIYYNENPEFGHFTLTNLPEGDYEWSYSIKYYNATDEVTEEFLNTFRVPSENEKKELVKKVENFKKEIKGFSPEMQHVLLLEYCVDQGIYHKLY